ncbi:probable ATP-dependent RNA helicase DHX35 [Clytia hemisphaerica]|uniref:RNA helicase n=1 Tax=Clytia hemisphaerica TaxID=252671 RepID=A0A7M5XKC2_9CNID
MNSKKMFWRPGQEKPGSDVKIDKTENGEGSGTFISFNSNVSLSMQQQKQRLPVFKYRNHILYAVENYQTVVISGSTGSGKTTQVPQYLFEAGWSNENQIIGITQPRRVAVTTIADRVAEEMGTFIGQTVGFSIRFEDCTDKELTKIKYMTDGYLVREMMSDPLLNKYSVIMLDEVHERTLFTDIVIGLLKKVLKRRPDLRLVISSATLDANKYKEFFNLKSYLNKKEDSSIVLNVEGRTFPVEIFYTQSAIPNYVKGCVNTVLDIHQNEPAGDILVFLTGQDEVENVVDSINQEMQNLKGTKDRLLTLPLYGGLSIQEQLKVFQRTPPNTRKVVVSTNVAEASVTINGIVYVVDSGFVKLRAYNGSTGLDSLVITPTSKASADQRAGRAGRVRSGKAFRLYPEEEFQKLDQFTVPEMQRSNMAPVVLLLKSLGISNVLRFSFLSSPPAQLMVQGVELLYALGAIDENANLTEPIGIRMAEFPVEPMLAKMLLTSGEFGCSEEACTLGAMLQVENVFFSTSNKKREAVMTKLKFSVKEGDHLTLINVYRAFVENKRNAQWCHVHFLNFKALSRVEKIRNQLISFLKRYDIPIVSCGNDQEVIQKCVVSGFFANVAKYHPSGEYRSIRNNQSLHLHPTSVLSTERKPPKLLIFHQVLCTSKDFMRDVTVIKLSWLLELASSYYDYGTDYEIATKKSRYDE